MGSVNEDYAKLVVVAQGGMFDFCNQIKRALSEIEVLRRENAHAVSRYNDLAREENRITPDLLKRYCDNARAYGWEIREQGYLGEDIPKVVTSTVNNPFVNPEWDAHLRDTAEGFILSSDERPL